MASGGDSWAVVSERWLQLAFFCCASFLCALPWNIFVRPHVLPLRFACAAIADDALYRGNCNIIHRLYTSASQAPIYYMVEERFEVGPQRVNALGNVRSSLICPICKVLWYFLWRVCFPFSLTDIAHVGWSGVGLLCSLRPENTEIITVKARPMFCGASPLALQGSRYLDNLVCYNLLQAS